MPGKVLSMLRVSMMMGVSMMRRVSMMLMLGFHVTVRPASNNAI